MGGARQPILGHGISYVDAFGFATNVIDRLALCNAREQRHRLEMLETGAPSLLYPFRPFVRLSMLDVP
jgi:hypothetical protein